MQSLLIADDLLTLSTANSSILIKNLKAGETYGVRVRGISNYNRTTGPYSDLLKIATVQRGNIQIIVIFNSTVHAVHSQIL